MRCLHAARGVSSETSARQLFVSMSVSRFGSLSAKLGVMRRTRLLLISKALTFLSVGKPSSLVMSLSVRSMQSNWFSVAPRFSMTASL